MDTTPTPHLPDANAGNMTTYLASLPLFNGVSGDALAALAASTAALSVTRGHILCHQDDAADRLYIITKGWVKLHRDTLDGQEAVLDMLTAHHHCGESALAEGTRYSWSAEAVEDSEVLAIPMQSARQLSLTEPAFLYNVVQAMAQHERQRDDELEHLKIQHAPQRIGCFLLKLVPQASLHGDVPCPPLHLPYNKSLLAMRLGMKAETFSRAFNTLKSEVGLQVEGATVTIPDVPRLADYTCSCCSKQFPCDNLIHG